MAPWSRAGAILGLESPRAGAMRTALAALADLNERSELAETLEASVE